MPPASGPRGWRSTSPGPIRPGSLLDAAEERLGRPSILVNTAAYSTRDGFEKLDAETLDAHYAVNVRAMALLSVEFARRYPGGPGGRIVNFSSGQSLGPMPGELAYAATKGAIEAFTRTLAAEVGHKGITVNAVNPGPTDTGWMTEELKPSSCRSSLRAGSGSPRTRRGSWRSWPLRRRPGSRAR